MLGFDEDDEHKSTLAEVIIIGVFICACALLSGVPGAAAGWAMIFVLGIGLVILLRILQIISGTLFGVGLILFLLTGNRYWIVILTLIGIAIKYRPKNIRRTLLAKTAKGKEALCKKD